MQNLTSAPARPPTTTQAPAELSLEDRLALVDAAMTVKLDEAAVAFEVNTAHIPAEVVDLADAITVPLEPAPHPLPDLYPTPVAALLQRAHHRLVTDGWCSGALIDERGARCLLGAIRKEAGGDQGLETRGVQVLTDAIRRKFREVDSVPSFNDSWANSRIPMRMLEEAASLADARAM
ncbi:hypothetical protein [Streptomyces sp. WAC05858]|uniref:DUF6197 family protein n=1 Tax=Streptomyces TaxID=1883 RepID=UPI000F774517|nr:hypothetical protein [Streptomyces sp. WAC05858]RSS33168.1 hypothetical protein EF902_44160 [Streptomyces sp. WAC05858]